VLVLFGLAFSCGTAAAEETVYLFSYFKETNGVDGLHLAYSLDGLSYHAVNGDAGLVIDTQTTPFMRDPSIIYGADGLFHLTYTTAWSGTSFGYMDSSNLLSWNHKKTVNIMSSVSGTEEVWAPESFYDSASGKYIVYWSSATSSGGAKKIYYSTTTDYSTFSTPAVLYDPGFTTIDATMVKDESNYVLFCKDERDGYKYVYKTTATSALGSYSTSSLQRVTGSSYSAEGPTAIQLSNGTWLVYNDHYGSGVMGAVASTDDMATWTEYTTDVSFPSGARHGTVLTVSRSAADYLIAHATNKTTEIEFDGNAGTSVFQTADNWLGSAVPGSSQVPVIQNDHTVDLNSSSSFTFAGIKVGQTGSGALNISGTTSLTLNSSWPNGLVIGQRAASSGSIDQSGTSTVTVNGYASIGSHGIGTYTLQSGSLTVTGDFNVGDILGSQGNFYMQGGTLSIPNLYLGSAYNDGTTSGSTVGNMQQSDGTVTVSGSGDLIVIGGRDNAYGIGTYTLSGGTFDSGSNANILVGKNGQGTFTQSGGTLYARKVLYLGRYSGSTGSYSISGGTLSQTSTSNRLYVGYAGAGTLTISGSGLVDASGGVQLSGSSSVTGEVYLNGGTLYTTIVDDGGGTSKFHFNGGTLKAKNATTTFMQGLDTVDVLSGGAVIDTNGYNVTIAQALLAGPSSGGLTKNGSGILTLTGTLTYSGETVINAGGLQLNTGTTTLAAISGAGELIVGGASTPTQLTATSISVDTLSIGTGSTESTSGISGDSLGDLDTTIAVPEPGVWVLLLIAAAAVCLKRR
jgi:autotransporter-associated beta strand protein/T5SS/PEP-CTERM-associated repeat protein